jgi:hypothetical protein
LAKCSSCPLARNGQISSRSSIRARHSDLGPARNWGSVAAVTEK